MLIPRLYGYFGLHILSADEVIRDYCRAPVAATPDATRRRRLLIHALISLRQYWSNDKS